mmetsp:Transcript_31650/g.35437  ORF Transcript_31650/g.35437 Transcript_31650/m.35437 type:complete len:335 (+) Transcript_31650:48-1052(+)
MDKNISKEKEKKMMPSPAIPAPTAPSPLSILGHFVVVSFAVIISYFSGCYRSLISYEVFQVLALSLGSIIGVAIVAGVLIYIPDVIDGRIRSENDKKNRKRDRRNRNHRNSHHHHNRGRTLHRSGDQDHGLSHNSNNNSNSKNLHKHSTTTTWGGGSASKIKYSSSSHVTSSLLPPRPSQPRTINSNNYNTNIITDRVYHQLSSNYRQRSRSRSRSLSSRSGSGSSSSSSRNSNKRRYSSPPSLPSQRSLSQDCLNPIKERKLEDLPDYDDDWWYELDSRTQYCALILGYTQVTWDEDHELDELPCEDWYWDEMTIEQRAAAQHFGYNKETWTD